MLRATKNSRYYFEESISEKAAKIMLNFINILIGFEERNPEHGRQPEDPIYGRAPTIWDRLWNFFRYVAFNFGKCRGELYR